MELDEIAVFVKVVQAGSFTKASTLLGATKSTVSTKVAALERRLGASLLHRTTRTLRLTNEGEAFFHTCARAIGDLEAASAVVVSGQAKPQGIIHVTAPTALGTCLLPAFLSGFLRRYPGINVKLSLNNRFVDLVEEGMDVAIRSGMLKDSSLVAKRIGTSFLSLYASPSYLKQHGTPREPQDLADHACLSFSPVGGAWSLSRAGKSVRVQVTTPIEVDDLAALKELALTGAGIALVPAFIAAADAAKKRLVAVLPEWHAHPTGLYAVCPAHRYQHPRVRVFVTEVAEALAEAFAP